MRAARRSGRRLGGDQVGAARGDDGQAGARGVVHDAEAARLDVGRGDADASAELGGAGGEGVAVVHPEVGRPVGRMVGGPQLVQRDHARHGPVADLPVGVGLRVEVAVDGLPAEHFTVEAAGLVDVHARELGPAHGVGLVHDAAGEGVRVPEAELGALRVGAQRQAPEVGDVGGLQELGSAGGADGVQRGGDVVGAEVHRPGLALRVVREAVHPRDRGAVDAAEREDLVLAEVVAGQRVGVPAEQAAVEVLGRLRVRAGQLGPGHVAGVVLVHLGHRAPTEARMPLTVRRRAQSSVSETAKRPPMIRPPGGRAGPRQALRAPMAAATAGQLRWTSRLQYFQLCMPGPYRFAVTGTPARSAAATKFSFITPASCSPMRPAWCGGVFGSSNGPGSPLPDETYTPMPLSLATLTVASWARQLARAVTGSPQMAVPASRFMAVRIAGMPGALMLRAPL